MLLKRLELSGFKSFAHPTILEFATPITAIVGPNGSGKSNIVEAMRFVLGEQSMKSLRGKRGEDLIFHGSKSLPRLGRASIAVVFDNAKEAFHLDYDEVEIRRVVYRDGTNQYFLNGSKTRLKDILELLAAVHIGASSHHIISQGETDRILSASPKERRAMIEDALGLKIYHYKLTESERKLAKTRDNIAQTETLRKEIASHLGFLEKQVARIREAETLRAELTGIYKEYLAGEEAILFSEKEQLVKEKAPVTREIEEVRRWIREKEAVGGVEKKNTGGDAEILGWEEKIRAIRGEKDALSRSLGRLEGLIEFGEKEKDRVAREESERVFFPKAAFLGFVGRIRKAIAEGEAALESQGLRKALGAVKEECAAFFRGHEGQREAAHEGDGLEKFVQEKEKTALALHLLSDKEREALTGLAVARAAREEERGAVAVIQKELFRLRTRENELKTQTELFLYREERIRQEEARFHAELAEAGHLLGTQMLRLNEGKVVSAALPVRAEQEKRKQKIERMKIKIEDVGGGGEETLKEYEDVRERDGFLAKEIADLLGTAESLEKLIRDLIRRIDVEFKDGIAKINGEFQEIFAGMFGGGNAALSIVRASAKKRRISEDEVLEGEDENGEGVEEEETEEGIDITLALPTKRVKGLGVLSGGERSLTSIALVFAITMVNPPPFLILDETDAALDESNSRKYGELLQKLKTRTQFLVVTHNRETMTRAGVLYGVTSSADGASRVLSVKMDEAEELAKEDKETAA